MVRLAPKGTSKTKEAEDRALYEYVTITVLILGVVAFARSGDCMLLYIACAMAGMEAGMPVVDFVKEIFRRDGSGKPGP